MARLRKTPSALVLLLGILETLLCLAAEPADNVQRTAPPAASAGAVHLNYAGEGSGGESAVSTVQKQDAHLLSVLDSETTKTHIGALQDPAAHCSSPDASTTHFCYTLREYAASVLVTQQLEGAECTHKSLEELKAEKRQRRKARRKQRIRGAAVTKAARRAKSRAKKIAGGLASAVAASHGEARSPSRKPQVQTSSSSGASLLQLPSLSDQAAQHEALAKDYAKQVQMARQNAQGRGDGSGLTQAAMKIFDASLYIQAGALLLTGMAKELLSSIVAAATAAPDGVSVELDPREVESTLRSVLVGGSSFAQPVAAFCVAIIEEALTSINAKTKTAQEAKADAFLALNDLHTTVATTAKLKAETTAAQLDAQGRQINQHVKTAVAATPAAGLKQQMAAQVVDLVLAIIDHPEDVTVVKYTKSSEGSRSSGGGGVRLSVSGGNEEPIAVPATPHVDLGGASPVVVPPVASVVVPEGSTKVSISNEEAAAAAAAAAQKRLIAEGGQTPDSSTGGAASVSSSEATVHPHFSSTRPSSTSHLSSNVHHTQGAPISVHLMRFGEGPASQSIPRSSAGAASAGPFVSQGLNIQGTSPMPLPRGIQIVHEGSDGAPQTLTVQRTSHGISAQHGPGTIGEASAGAQGNSAPGVTVHRIRFGDGREQQNPLVTRPGDNTPPGGPPLQHRGVQISFGVEGPRGSHVGGSSKWDAPSASAATAGAGAAAAAGVPIWVHQQLAAPDLTQLSIPGFTATAAPLSSLPFYQTMGQAPSIGPRFHGVQVDYALGNVGTPNDICVTEAMLFPTGWMGSGPPGAALGRSTRGSPHSMGSLAASVAERWAFRKAQEATQQSITFFRSSDSIKKHVDRLLKKHLSQLQEVTAPAPSFNTLTSSGCRSHAEEARRAFYNLFFGSNRLFESVLSNPTANARLQLRAQLLHSHGVIPAMPVEVDRMMSQEVRKIQNSVHSGEKAAAYGFLDACGKKCYSAPNTRRGDVLLSAVFSLDHTLMKLNTMAYRGLSLTALFFGNLSSSVPHLPEETKQGQIEEASRQLIAMWGAEKGRKAKKGDAERLPPGEVLPLLEVYTAGLERLVSLLLQSPHTQHLFNLATHTWVQLRGIYNAAEGFKPDSNFKATARNKQLAAVFSKLWFDGDATPQESTAEAPILKPFFAPLASVSLQIAFFLHSVVEEFKRGLWGRLGASIRSFFQGLFRKHKRMNIPSTWSQMVSRAQAQQTADPKGFQGALWGIEQLADFFFSRFIRPSALQSSSSPLMPSYIAFVHALVSLWMANPRSPTQFRLNDPQIPKAKKLFYYSLLLYPRSLTKLAADLIISSCTDMKAIDMGVVTATVEFSGKRQTVGRTVLKHKRVPLRFSTLMYHLNKLLAAYDDPLDIVRVAQDLATRCKTPEQPQPEQRKKRILSFTKEFNRNNDRAVQLLSSKFVLDTWCLQYKDFIMKNMTRVPQTKSGSKLFLLLEAELDKTAEVVLRPSAAPADSWVLNIKCPFMKDFVDPEKRQEARKGMMQYAITRRSLGKRLIRKVNAIGNFFVKKFSFKRKRVPGSVANKEFAVIHVGTSIWYKESQRFEHALTFRPEAMSCGTRVAGGPRKPVDFRNGDFVMGSTDPAADEDAVLCVNQENMQCWATRRALMFKGSTEAPVSHSETPAGMWYARLTPTNP